MTFTANVNGGTDVTMAPGNSQTLRYGQTLTITDERVTGLPTTCSYVSDLPADGASFTATRSVPDGTITVTNTVTCTGTATVAKDWTGDTFDDTGVAVEFTANVNGGEAFTMAPDDSQTLDLGDTLTIMSEDVTGMPEACEYVSSLPADGASFTATGAHPDGTITITNDVTCDQGGVLPETVVNVRLEKVWDVTDPSDVLDTSTISVTFTLDGYDGTFVPGDQVAANPGDVLVVDETMGDLPGACELTDTVMPSYTVTDASGQVLTVTNVVRCAEAEAETEVEGVVVTKPATLPATGADTGDWALIAALLAGAGALLLLATREEEQRR